MFENYVTLKTNRGVTDLRFFYFCCCSIYIGSGTKEPKTVKH